jgi:hypothetical protein
MFWYNTYFKCCFGFFFNKTWDYFVIWIHVFNNVERHKLYSEFYVHILCEFFIVSYYDEMNCNLVSGVFYNVFWSDDFGYMQ